MIAILSPSKTLDYESALLTDVYNQSELLTESEHLVSQLRKFDQSSLQDFLGVSEKIAVENFNRYTDWSVPFNLDNARQALLAFAGDVYTDFELEQYCPADFEFAQQHLRILSGLYGVLRPLDLMQPYRLEMGSQLKTDRGNNLYDFWGDMVTDILRRDLERHEVPVLIDLSSKEYGRVVDEKKLGKDVIDIQFKEYKDGAYKVVAVYAKRARGALANFMVRNRVTAPDDLKSFTADGYRFAQKMSSARTYVFVRKS